MGINLAISTALSGLTTVQRQLDTVSQNVSNTQTPGYTRKYLPQESVVVGGVNGGVIGGELHRTVDTQLQNQLMRQSGTLDGLNIKQNYLQSIEQLQGRPEDETSLSSTFTKLEQAFQSLSASPESTTYQLQAVNAATNLVNQLHTVSNQILTLRNQTQQDIANGVTTVNNNLQRIATLNDQIVSEHQLGHSTVDIEDQRDQAMTQLSSMVDINYVRTTDNRFLVFTSSGQSLVDQSAKSFQFTSTLLTDSSYYRLSPPGNIQPITSTGDGVDATGQFKGGQLGALLELRDSTLPQAQAQLDEFTQKMAMRFQQQGMTLFTDQLGKTPLVPADMPGNYVGFASSVMVNTATADPNFVRYGDAGTPANPSTIANLPVSNVVITRILSYTFGDAQDPAGTPHPPFRTSPVGPDLNANMITNLPSTAILGDYIQNLTAMMGSNRAAVTTTINQTQSLRDTLATRDTNTSGVNLDTEIANLTILQRSYGASAQILKTSEQLLDQLLAVLH